MGSQLIPLALAGVGFVFLLSIFGGGALLFVGARFIAKIPTARYWPCVGINLVAGISGTIAGGIIGGAGSATGTPELALVFSLVGMAGSLVVTWLVIMAMLHTTYGKAILAWLPTLAQLVVVVPLLVAMLLPGLTMARELARRASCKANLSGIGMTLAMYAADNRDIWPPDLQTIAKRRPDRVRLECPSSNTAPGSGQSDYFYLPATSKSDSRTIVACDFRANHHDGFRNVLYADLRVGDCLTEAQFQQELAQPYNAAFAKALRATEGP